MPAAVYQLMKRTPVVVVNEKYHLDESERVMTVA